MNKIQDLAAEWSLLHGQYQTFENYSLVIKLVAVTLVAQAFIFAHVGWGVLAVVLIFWFTEAVWKTFQARTEADLRFTEQQIDKFRRDGVGHDSAESSFQVYSRWASNRPATTALIGQYISAAKQPTVALTYLLLSGLVLLVKLMV